MSIFTQKRDETAKRKAAEAEWKVQVSRAYTLHHSAYISAVAGRNGIKDPYQASTAKLLQAAADLRGALDLAEQDKADRP